jgi:hypothetical protein
MLRKTGIHFSASRSSGAKRLIGWLATKPRDVPAPRGSLCGACAYFDNDPQRMEAAIPGLASLSSGHACVRADDGLCHRHDRYVSARFGCGDFCARESV